MDGPQPATIRRLKLKGLAEEDWDTRQESLGNVVKENRIFSEKAQIAKNSTQYWKKLAALIMGIFEKDISKAKPRNVYAARYNRPHLSMGKRRHATV